MDSNYLTTSEPGGETTKTIGRYNGNGNNNKDGSSASHNQRGRASSNGSGRQSKWILDRLEVPEEVVLFEQFEELSKFYAIEAPTVARSQVELVFDVFDGRKLKQVGLMDEEDEEENAATDIEQLNETGQQRSSVAGPNARASKLRNGKSSGTNLTWSKLLSFKRRGNSYNKTGSSGACQAKMSPLKCCLSKSDTTNEFGCSISTSGSFMQPAMAGLAREPSDDQEAVELKEEAQRIIGLILSRLRRRSSLLANLMANNELQSLSPSGGLEQQQQVILGESAGGQNDSNQISVCLFDKRGRLVKLKREAENGRRRAQVEAKLEELARWQRDTTISSSSSGTEAQLVDRMIARKFGHLETIKGFTEVERLSSGQLTTLVDLTKNSLNHLIDAQLLLRNKLTNEQEQLQKQQQFNQQQQYQQQQSRIGISMEYDALLRNNFNLLKVWQNLEETKRLVCFVCEPIKSNLSDLFWFSRQRLAGEISGKLASPGDSLLVSPLVSLDGIQVKRGLLQVSNTVFGL